MTDAPVLYEVPRRPLILDLFCGEGGASEGYVKAGFDVIGVDNVAQPRYPYEFWGLDALEVLKYLIGGYTIQGVALEDFTAIHASPPCQRYSVASQCRPGLAETYPDLIPPVRERLKATRLPYIIENVPLAPLNVSVELCGSQFGLVTEWNGVLAGLRRHRVFETNWPVKDPGPHDHSYLSIPVFGHGAGGKRIKIRGKGLAAATRQVMGIHWMTRDGLNEAIPPAYTRYLGSQLLDHLDTLEGVAA